MSKNKHSYNLPMWRKSLIQIQRGRCTTYPKMNYYGELEFYVMAPSKNQMIALCYTYIKCPCAWIKIKRRSTSPKKFFYVKLVDRYSASWFKFLKREEHNWKYIKRGK